MADFDAREYLIRNVLSEGVSPLPDLAGVCTQVDHETAALRKALKRCADALREMSSKTLSLGLSGAVTWDELGPIPDVHGPLREAAKALGEPQE